MPKKVVRISMTLPKDLLEAFDETARLIGYDKRSKALRDAIRNFISDYKSLKEKRGARAGTITFIYNHKITKISDILTDIQHEYSEVIDATLHIHLDEERCLEVLTVRGEAGTIKNLTERLMSIRGVENLKPILI